MGLWLNSSCRAPLSIKWLLFVVEWCHGEFFTHSKILAASLSSRKRLNVGCWCEKIVVIQLLRTSSRLVSIIFWAINFTTFIWYCSTTSSFKMLLSNLIIAEPEPWTENVLAYSYFPRGANKCAQLCRNSPQLLLQIMKRPGGSRAHIFFKFKIDLRRNVSEMEPRKKY